MIKIFLLFFVAVLGVAAFAADRPVIKVGVILPMTGNNASFGQSGREGILLRLKELSADAKFDYKFIFEDDGFESSRTNLAAWKLRSVDKVDAIISMWGQASSVIVPRIKDASIINLSADRWGTYIPYKYDFIVGPSLGLYTDATLEALRRLGVKKVAMFSSAIQGQLAFDRMFKEKLKNRGFDLVFYTSLPDDIRDLRTAILKAREAKPDIVLDCFVMPLSQILLKQMKDIGYSPLVGCPSAYLLDVTDPTLVEGTFYVLNIPADTNFSARFKAEYGHNPKYMAMFTYDISSLFINACEQCPVGEKPDTDAICAKLRQTTNFPAVIGPVTYEAPNQLNAPTAYYLIQNGQHKVVSLDELVKFYKK